MESNLPLFELDLYEEPEMMTAIRSALAQAIRESPCKIIVLDDDPTGTQTVHDVPVHTQWSEEAIQEGFDGPSPLFFILTNSRSFSRSKTEAVHRQIAENILAVSKRTGKPFLLVSRGDSTLRGHYPLETETLQRTFEKESSLLFDGEILVPFFPEGGRYTIGDVQYVRQDEALVPVGQTEFASDKTFGYRSSNLKAWCEEKTEGAVAASSVVGIELEDLRRGEVHAIECRLNDVHDFGKVVVNAIDYCDLEVFALALFRALASGRHFMIRGAASIVKVLGGIADQPLLSHDRLVDRGNSHGGIVIVGSHVGKTTRQLERLQESNQLSFIVFDQHRVLEKDGLQREVERVVALVERIIASGKSVVVHTRRERIDLPSNDKEGNLALSVAISDALVEVIARLSVRPSFIVAKGGITSSDVATKALQVKKAMVLGQVEKGIPVWSTGPESRFPSLPYVVFPGNVGPDDALVSVARTLLGR